MLYRQVPLLVLLPYIYGGNLSNNIEINYLEGLLLSTLALSPNLLSVSQVKFETAKR